MKWFEVKQINPPPELTLTGAEDERAVGFTQAVHDPTPPKKPTESAALTGHAAAAHAAPVAFYGSHRVFLGAPPAGAWDSKIRHECLAEAFPWLLNAAETLLDIRLLHSVDLSNAFDTRFSYGEQYCPQSQLSQSRQLWLRRPAPALWQPRPGAPSPIACAVCALTWRCRSPFLAVQITHHFWDCCGANQGLEGARRAHANLLNVHM